MKLIIHRILFILFFASIIFSCEEAENPNKIPDGLPRFDEVKANYKSILTSSENGWVVSYQPSESAGVFTILMKYKDNGTVTIYSDMSDFTATANDVFYDVKGSTYPELVFETFCVWHQLYELADGDFQFRILSINENTIELGFINSSSTHPDLTFTRATQADYEKISGLQEIDKLLYDFYNGTDKVFKIMQFDEPDIKGLIDFDFDKHQVYINTIDAAGISTTSLANYSYDENGIVFTSELIIGGEVISRFDISQTVDTALNLSGSPLKDGIIYATYMPDFEFTGAVDLFNQYTFFYVGDYSPSLDTLDQQIQDAGAFVGVQIYRDYALSSSQSYNALTFIIFEESDDYDFYGFYISQFIKLGEDKIRFQWSGGRDENVTNELFEILRNYILFFFDQHGFKIIPSNNSLIFVSYANPENYLVVVPVS